MGAGAGEKSRAGQKRTGSVTLLSTVKYVLLVEGKADPVPRDGVAAGLLQLLQGQHALILRLLGDIRHLRAKNTTFFFMLTRQSQENKVVFPMSLILSLTFLKDNQTEFCFREANRLFWIRNPYPDPNGEFPDPYNSSYVSASLGYT